MKTLKIILILLAASLFGAGPILAAEDQEKAASGKESTITGEVLDMVCYLDSGKSGEGHAKCARGCIESGTPVGLKAEDGKTYLLIGEHKPMNKELSEYAGKMITVRGKVVSRDGVSMIENTEIQK